MKRERKAPAADRLAVIEKIEEYERLGYFDRDVEDDPPGRVLRPDEVRYLDRRFSAKFKRNVGFAAAHFFFWIARRKKQMILKPAQGLSHLSEVKGGAVITCNHFNPFDRFVMQLVYDAAKRRGRMYSVIKEGNYTSFPGFFGFLMRACDTLPLSSDPVTMKHFLKAVKTALSEGNCVLIYPEQSLWWNYRKPKPMKSGAFEMAVRSGVPVIPCFITLADSDLIGEDGFPVQIYTPHVGAPIYPDPSLNTRAAAEKMCAENYAFCKEIYERVYGIPLSYTTEEERVGEEE